MLGANVEQLFLREGSGPNAGVGNGEQNLIVGNSEANILDGGANNDQLEGGGGSDTLEGGTGTDGMIGGDGNDTYFVDSVFDVIVENANEGIDTVYTNSNYIIGANVEQLYLLEAGGATTGVGNGEQNLLVGNSFANALDGGANNDTLMAGGGNDTLFGGIGADAMSGEAGNDTILIADSNFAMIDGGADLDRITLNTPGQTFDLTANAAKISNVEIISLTASAGASLSLTNTDIPTVNAAGNSLYVLGGIDDTGQCRRYLDRHFHHPHQPCRRSRRHLHPVSQQHHQFGTLHRRYDSDDHSQPRPTTRPTRLSRWLARRHQSPRRGRPRGGLHHRQCRRRRYQRCRCDRRRSRHHGHVRHQLAHRRPLRSPSPTRTRARSNIWSSPAPATPSSRAIRWW